MFELNFLLSLYTVLVNKLGISIMGVVLETIAEKKNFQEPYLIFHIKSDLSHQIFRIFLQKTIFGPFAQLQRRHRRRRRLDWFLARGFKGLPGYITTTH